MDTRSKILTLDAALRLPPGTVTLVTGYFDALRAAHVRDLEALARPVLALVLPLAGELLPQAARAEMVAALRVIDYVVSAPDTDLDALIHALAPRELVRLETRDAERNRQLIEHVHSRQTR
jgi:bifunctional ADP-heptose synthase (sugar kinase/adenylyltransferase)